MSRIVPYIKKGPPPTGQVLRVKAYLRVSTLRQVRSDGDFGSLDKQMHAIEYFLDLNKANNWSINQKISDKAELGDDPSRPGFQSLIAAARNHEFDILVVMSQDRLARGSVTLEPFICELESYGIQIYETSGRRISVKDPNSRIATRPNAPN